jgi:thiol-disulfide isomerase/thioredoxin
MNWIEFIQDQRRWRIIMVAVLSLAIGWTFLSRIQKTAMNAGDPPASPRQGFKAPDFTLELLGGGEVTLSQLQGQPVVLNLWASWCLPCRAEMPAIERVYQSYEDRGLVILGVNTTVQDNEAKAASFVQEYGLTFPIPLDRDGSVSARYALGGLPTTFFIDREGIIRSVILGGPMSEAVIRSKVEDLMD